LANREISVGGIVIDGLNIKKDLFYYKIPLFLLKKAEIGCRVKIPFGSKNEPHTGFLFSIKKTTESENLKNIEEIISEPFFDKKIRDLILFVSEKYFIPLHILINKVLKGTISTTYRKYVICIDTGELREALKKYSGKKKNVAEMIVSRRILPVAVIKKRFGQSVEKYLKDLEEEGIIERKNTSEELTKNYYSVIISRGEADEALSKIEDKKLRNSAIQILGRLFNANAPVREPDLRKGIKKGRSVISLLLKNGVIKSASLDKKYEHALAEAAYYLIEKMTLDKRTSQIIKILKKENKGRALIVFPEIALISRAKEQYKKAFKEEVFVWDGINKRKLVEAIYFQDKKIILSTFFPMFIKIPELEYLVLEDASSKYFKNSSFIPFDVEITAIKKADIEKLNLIFSTSVPDENIYILLTKNKIKKIYTSEKSMHYTLKLIDMREEFKKHNYKMLSLYLQKRIKEILGRDGNVAIILNRKSYSTFVMCRECGYVLRCPNCKVPLYYDKEKNLLVCPVCGYTERPPDICPRCKSPSIKYFSGGLQKLEEQLKKEFKNAEIIRLTSETGSKNIVFSKDFSSTIFIGTEFLQSHLTLENIELFAFISIDIFLNHYSFDASFNTFRVIANAMTEMKGKEVIVQTYVPEHFALRSSINLDYKKLFKEEFFLRKQLNYPPFNNLVIFSFSGKDQETVLKLSSKFAKEAEALLHGKNDSVLGPSPAPVEKRGLSYYYEVNIKTEKIIPALRNIYLEFAKATSSVKISASSFLSIEECLGRQ
jgi:primosomal protein N' (replication factor Y)